MTHVQYLACDGCGEKIDEDKKFISLELTSRDEKGEIDKDNPFFSMHIAMFGEPRRSEHTHYHFHNDECLARFMVMYSKKGVPNGKG